MSIRIPASLKWLITEKAKLSGQLQKVSAKQRALGDQLASLVAEVDALQEQYQQLTANRVQLESDCNCIDRVLRMHALGVNPEVIAPMQSYSKVVLVGKASWRDVILECLHAAAPDKVSTTHVVGMMGEATNLSTAAKESLDFRRRVRKVLRYLCDTGLVLRHHEKGTHEEGYWSIPPSG